MNVTRRGMLTGGFASVGAGVLGACTHAGAGRDSASPVTTTATASPSSRADVASTARWLAADDRRQSGVITPPAAHGRWLGFDLPNSASRDDLRRVLILLSDVAERIVSGRSSLTDQATEMAANPGDIAMTVGLGPHMFELEGMPKAPNWLKPLPAFSIDKFEQPWHQTDLVVQVGGDDPLRTSHAAHQVALALNKSTRLVWQQTGTRPTPAPADNGVVRNHFGQLDGQVNTSGTGRDAAVVWNSASAGKAWMQDSTAMVIRRIRMDVTTWDSLDRQARENSVGRRLSNGAPLTGAKATDPVDLEKADELGLPIINPASHVARAMPAKPSERILRRPYNYERETDDGTFDKGLIFVAFCADVTRQFVPIQRRLAEADILNTWTTPIGSGVYFVPQAPKPGEYLGQTLLQAGG